MSDMRYTDPETPFALAEKGDVGLLSFNWLQARAESGEPLPRRQDLPPEAFVDVAALRAMHAAAPAHVLCALSYISTAISPHAAAAAATSSATRTPAAAAARPRRTAP